MPPVIHCVRHAQGAHSLSHTNHSMLDPELTPLGEVQCANLCSLLAEKQKHENIGLIVSSPLRRAIQTALVAFKPLIDRGYKVIALPEIQEVSDQPGDTGSDLAVIQAQLENMPIDWSMVEPGWNIKEGKWAPSAERLLQRAKEARKWLMQRPEKEIVLVSHGCFLHFLTDDWIDSLNSHATSWKNAELRTFVFADDNTDGPCLIETLDSRQARGLATEAPSKEEQSNMRKSSLQTWIGWGVMTEV